MLSRRAVLGAGVSGAAALILAACSPEPEPSAAPSATPPPASAPTITPSPTPSPTHAPTLEAVVAGLLIVGFRGMAVADAPWLRAAIAGGLGGVILFDRDQLTGGARNIASPGQVAALTAELRDAAGDRPLLIGIDQEGGRVTRLSPAHGFPAVASEASIGRGTEDEARTWAAAMVETLVAVGIDLNFAPVVDLNVNPRSPAIGALDRSFSADPEVVVRMAAIEIEAHRAEGVRTTLKHFPGIGSSTTNTDFGVADVTTTWTRAELEPFRRLIAAGDADLIMAGHIVNRNLDAAHPASLSPGVVAGLLRTELAWDGPIVTDDLQAAAITTTFGADEAILLALEAGNDLLLFANQQAYDPGVVDHVVAVVGAAVESGRLSEVALRASLARVQRLRR